MSMKSAKINNEISLNYPDAFTEMNPEELTRYFSAPDNRWGAYDADRHIILSVSWTKAKFLQSDPEMRMIDVESRMRRNLLNYQRIAEFRPKIGGKKAYGIRFEYRVKDKKLVQVGDLMMFKHKKSFYAVHYITRKYTAAADRADFEEILNSVTVS